MIAYIEGRLSDKSPTRIVVLVGGVGYELNIPVSTYYELPDEGAEVALRVHTHVREDVIALYGFLSAMEERLFERLISVAGVGPSLALKVMSGLEPPVLVESIRRGDLKRLNAIPGVGKKTAERLILELRDKMPAVVGPDELRTRGEGEASQSMVGDLVSALSNLGFPRPQAEKTVQAVVREEPGIGFEEALKKTLRKLSG